VLVPFDLTTIDSNRESQEILVKRIINIGKSYMLDSGKLREGSTIMIAKLITRPDVVKSGVTDEVFGSLTTEYEESLNKTGTLQKITAILH
jgi:hypothetical protein